MGERMVVESSRDLIRELPNRWREQYGAYPSDHKWALVLERLESLDTVTATVEEVDAIIGNHSGAREYCDVCEKPVDSWIRLGDEPDYDSATVYICSPCLRAAAALLDGVVAVPPVVSSTMLRDE